VRVEQRRARPSEQLPLQRLVLRQHALSALHAAAVERRRGARVRCARLGACHPLLRLPQLARLHADGTQQLALHRLELPRGRGPRVRVRGRRPVPRELVGGLRRLRSQRGGLLSAGPQRCLCLLQRVRHNGGVAGRRPQRLHAAPLLLHKVQQRVLLSSQRSNALLQLRGAPGRGVGVGHCPIPRLCDLASPVHVTPQRRQLLALPRRGGQRRLPGAPRLLEPLAQRVSGLLRRLGTLTQAARRRHRVALRVPRPLQLGDLQVPGRGARL
jgi:hypothetical protein